MGTDTKKIWVTLPETYINAIEIIAEELHGSSRNKADVIKNFLNVYVEEKRDFLKENNIYRKILIAKRGKEFTETYEQKLKYVEDYVSKFWKEDEAIQNELFQYKEKKDEEGINRLYDKVEKKINYLKEVGKERKFIKDYLDNFGPDKKIFMKFTIYEEEMDVEAIRDLYEEILEKMKA